MSAGAVVPEVALAAVGIARTVVMRSVKPGTTPDVALGTVVWLPANARILYWRRMGSGALFTTIFSFKRSLGVRR